MVVESYVRLTLPRLLVSPANVTIFRSLLGHKTTWAPLNVLETSRVRQEMIFFLFYIFFQVPFFFPRNLTCQQIIIIFLYNFQWIFCFIFLVDGSLAK